MEAHFLGFLPGGRQILEALKPLPRGVQRCDPCKAPVDLREVTSHQMEIRTTSALNTH